MSTDTDEDWMRKALLEAQMAAEEGEVPVAALVVMEGEVIGRAHNLRETLNDPTAHAEVLALRNAAERRGNWRLDGATVYCTLEPCCMCAGALVNARVDRVVYGLSDPKSGACESVAQILQIPELNHRVEYCGGVLADDVLSVMREFFESRRP